MKPDFRKIAVGLALVFGFTGCGYKELPGLKEKAEGSFREMLVQYRLRADLVPHFLKLVEDRKEPQWQALSKEVRNAYLQAVGMDMPLSQYNEKQINRLQSFQYRLSSELVKMKNAMDNDPKVSKAAEYLSLKTQLETAEARIAGARQKYMADGPTFNAKLTKTPEKWFNNWFYKFEPLPVLENSAVN